MSDEQGKAPEPQIVPTIGRIVEYKLTGWQADDINQRREDYRERAAWHSAIRSGAQLHAGNEVYAGEKYPAMIVKTWGDEPTSAVNLQVFLDGTDTYWATSVSVGEKEGDYQWMAYQKGQAAKAEALEKQIVDFNTPVEPPTAR